MRSTPLLPSPSTTLKLFTTGASVGPIVDSFHNQCLLQYDIAPISLSLNGGDNYFFCSSWLIPPLLGVAYVVLGGILPRMSKAILPPFELTAADTKLKTDDTTTQEAENQSSVASGIRNKALLAVLTTALIIRLSEFLETNPNLQSDMKLTIMSVAAFTQWALLDQTPAAFLSAFVTSIGGPLSELPFVAAGCWHYLPQAADYFPLENISGGMEGIVKLFGGEDFSIGQSGLSSITGPCYFAVTMDAIALGRWFDLHSTEKVEDT